MELCTNLNSCQVIKNRRLTIRWGRSQGQKNPIAADGGSAAAAVAPGTVTVPGLAPTLPKPPEELTNNFFNIGAGMLRYTQYGDSGTPCIF